MAEHDGPTGATTRENVGRWPTGVLTRVGLIIASVRKSPPPPPGGLTSPSNCTQSRWALRGGGATCADHFAPQGLRIASRMAIAL